MARIIINAFLVTAFISIVVAISAPFLAAERFSSTERLITGYLWKDAEKKLVEAINIDPYDSRYPARLGEFLFTQGGYKDNKAPLLKKAEGYYLRAAALNPRCAEYYVKLGQINISLFIDDAGKQEYIDKAFENFKKAIENDPNGFNTAYAAGYSSLAVWKYLDDNEKTIVIDRLKYALKQKPWYSEYIYPQVLRKTGDPKLIESITPEVESRQCVDPRMVQKLKDDAVSAKASGLISRSNWQGTAFGGGNAYENGNMYWSGTVYGAILLPKGDALISVDAKSSPSDGIYPYMLLFLDGKKIGSAYADSAEFKKYSFTATTDGGIKVLSVTFTNDAGNDKEDRNLFIGNARAEQI